MGADDVGLAGPRDRQSLLDILPEAKSVNLLQERFSPYFDRTLSRCARLISWAAL
jgi:hypothetical protein